MLIKVALATTFFAISLTNALAQQQQQQPIQRTWLRATTYTCQSSGCYLKCKNLDGKFIEQQTIDRTVQAILWSNGVTEYRNDNGSNGMWTTVTSTTNTFCTVSGYSGSQDAQ